MPIRAYAKLENTITVAQFIRKLERFGRKRLIVLIDCNGNFGKPKPTLETLYIAYGGPECKDYLTGSYPDRSLGEVKVVVI